MGQGIAAAGFFQHPAIGRLPGYTKIRTMARYADLSRGGVYDARARAAASIAAGLAAQPARRAGRQSLGYAVPASIAACASYNEYMCMVSLRRDAAFLPATAGRRHKSNASRRSWKCPRRRPA